MNCPYCGNPSLDGAAFCGNCGAKLEALPAPSTPAPEVLAAAPELAGALPAPEPEPAPAPSPEPPPAPAYAPPAAAYTPSYTAPTPPPQKKGNRTLLIIVAVVLLSLCYCCILIFALFSMIPWDTTSVQEFQFIFGTPTPARIR